MLGITSEAEVPDEPADCLEKGGSSRAPEGKAVKGATPAHADSKEKKNLTRRLVELCAARVLLLEIPHAGRKDAS